MLLQCTYQKGFAIHFRHPYVTQDIIIDVVTQTVKSFFAISRLLGTVPLAGQHDRQHVAQVFFIIYDQNMLVLFHESVPFSVRARGNQTLKQLPSPTLLAAVIRPPNPSTIRAEIASPRPVPLPGGLVVKNGSKICFMDSSGIPVPLSMTSSRICPPSCLAPTVMIPPAGVASRLLRSRLTTTC